MLAQGLLPFEPSGMSCAEVHKRLQKHGLNIQTVGVRHVERIDNCGHPRHPCSLVAGTLIRTGSASQFAQFCCFHYVREDWLFKDEMSGAVKLGGGCAALARMQAVPFVSA